MTVRTQTHIPTAFAIIPSAGMALNFSELYDLQDGGIDSTNMNMAETYAWSGPHSFTANTNFDSGLQYIDATNNRVYWNATASTTVDSLTFQHQFTIASAATTGRVVISTAGGSTGVREASWQNSSSPAANDHIHEYHYYGNNASAGIIEYARTTVQILSTTAGSENGLWYAAVMDGGTLTNKFLVYNDQAHSRSESFVIGTTTNQNPEGNTLGLYVYHSDSNRRVALFQSNDNSASGAAIDIYKNSSSPAVSDSIGFIRFMGNDSAGNYQQYSAIQCFILDETSGTEDGSFVIQTTIAGTNTTVATFSGNANGGIQFAQIVDITSTSSSFDSFTVTNSSVTTNSLAVFYSNSTSTSSRSLVVITNDSTSADNVTCLHIQNDGNTTASKCITLSPNTNGYGCEVANAGSTIAYKVIGSGSGDIGFYSDGVVQAIYATNFNYLVTIAAGDYSGAALGAYGGKIPISVGGLGTRYFPFYS